MIDRDPRVLSPAPVENLEVRSAEVPLDNIADKGDETDVPGKEDDIMKSWNSVEVVSRPCGPFHKKVQKDKTAMG